MVYIIKKLEQRLQVYLSKYCLNKKWDKINILLEQDLSHTSLHFKKIVLKGTVFYSFRLDNKYRGICLLQNNVIEIILFTNHYK